jgi:hypothetical protein
MARYKTVEVPRFNVGHDSNLRDAVKQFNDIIDRDTADGWELVCTHTINVVQEPKPLPPIGCLTQILTLINVIKRAEPPDEKHYEITLMIFVKK